MNQKLAELQIIRQSHKREYLYWVWSNDMSTRNTVLSSVQKEGKKGTALTSALNSAFDNANNNVAVTAKKKEDKKKK